MSINVIRLFRLCCFYTRECTGFNNIGAQGVFFAEWVNSQWSDQSDHDTRIWWHGWAASEQRLQATPPFSSLRLRLARFVFAPLHMTACSQAKLSFVSSSDVSVFRTLPMHLSVLIIFTLFFFFEMILAVRSNVSISLPLPFVFGVPARLASSFIASLHS